MMGPGREAPPTVFAACGHQLELEGILPPLAKEGEEFSDENWTKVSEVLEQLEREGVVPPEGGSTKTTDTKQSELPF